MEQTEYNLQTDGVEMIRYPLELQASVADAAELWRQFCNLPDGIKQSFVANDDFQSIGYELKDGRGVNADRKENFDYALKGDANLAQTVDRVGSGTARQFFAAIQDLYGKIQPLVDQFGRDVDLAGKTKDFHDLALSSADNAFIRFIHYPGGTASGGSMAEPHTDHSGFTFHLFETTNGCERLAPDGGWKPLPVADGEAVAFGGMQTQLATHGDIKALCHRVVANETSSEVGRLAIVCFVALKDTALFNKKKYGRLQEMPAGFNYNLPYEEFTKLFISR